MMYCLTPILVGALSGIAYGCSFLIQQRGILFYKKQFTNRLINGACFVLRIMILVYAGCYLLHSPLLPSILGSIAFFVLFWLMVLNAKASLHEHNGFF